MRVVTQHYRYDFAGMKNTFIRIYSGVPSNTEQSGTRMVNSIGIIDMIESSIATVCSTTTTTAVA